MNTPWEERAKNTRTQCTKKKKWSINKQPCSNSLVSKETLIKISFLTTILCLVAQSCPTFATPWTIAHQAPLSMEILQARILEWVAMPFSRGSSQPRDQAQVSHNAGRFFTVLSHQGSPWILEWVAYSFSRGSFQSRDRTQVSHITSRFFTIWATREAQEHWSG